MGLAMDKKIVVIFFVLLTIALALLTYMFYLATRNADPVVFLMLLAVMITMYVFLALLALLVVTAISIGKG